MIKQGCLPRTADQGQFQIRAVDQEAIIDKPNFYRLTCREQISSPAGNSIRRQLSDISKA